MSRSPFDAARGVAQDRLAGHPPVSRAQVAQLVEHVTENHGVGGSIPSLGTTPQKFGETCLSVEPVFSRF